MLVEELEYKGYKFNVEAILNPTGLVKTKDGYIRCEYHWLIYTLFDDKKCGYRFNFIGFEECIYDKKTIEEYDNFIESMMEEIVYAIYSNKVKKVHNE